MIARDGVWSVDSVRGFGKIGRGGAAGDTASSERGKGLLKAQLSVPSRLVTR
jgi:hypothetical protein